MIPLLSAVTFHPSVFCVCKLPLVCLLVGPALLSWWPPEPSQLTGHFQPVPDADWRSQSPKHYKMGNTANHRAAKKKQNKKSKRTKNNPLLDRDVLQNIVFWSTRKQVKHKFKRIIVRMQRNRQVFWHGKCSFCYAFCSWEAIESYLSHLL